jgi:hypothetical protein
MLRETGKPLAEGTMAPQLALVAMERATRVTSFLVQRRRDQRFTSMEGMFTADEMGISATFFHFLLRSLISL